MGGDGDTLEERFNDHIKQRIIFQREHREKFSKIKGLKDGGVTGNTPQLVIVGDGGEKEYIVPESKLSYFLGTSQAAKYLNYGISPLITAAKKYASSEGIDTSSIKELKDVSDVPSENVKPITGLEVNLGKTFFDNVKKGLMKLLNPFSSAITIIKKLNPFNWFKKSKKDKPKSAIAKIRRIDPIPCIIFFIDYILKITCYLQ